MPFMKMKDLPLIVHLTRLECAKKMPANEILNDAAALAKAGNHLQALGIYACNISSLSDKQKQEEAEAEKTIHEICKKYELTADCGGDPRGAVVRIKGLPNTCFGGEGYGIS